MLAREQAERGRRAAILAGRKVSLSPRGTDPVFYDAEHRWDYFWARSTKSYEDWLNWNDVRNGKLTPDERRAISKGRHLSPSSGRSRRPRKAEPSPRVQAVDDGVRSCA